MFNVNSITKVYIRILFLYMYWKQKTSCDWDELKNYLLDNIQPIGIHFICQLFPDI